MYVIYALIMICSISFCKSFKRTFMKLKMSTTSEPSINNIDTTSSAYYLHKILVVEGTVEPGYGRGSKKLGFPTANLPHFNDQINTDGLSRGVYFGKGKLLHPQENYYFDFVANIGLSPTFVGEVSLHNIINIQCNILTHTTQ